MPQADRVGGGQPPRGEQAGAAEGPATQEAPAAWPSTLRTPSTYLLTCPPTPSPHHTLDSFRRTWDLPFVFKIMAKYTQRKVNHFQVDNPGA